MKKIILVFGLVMTILPSFAQEGVDISTQSTNILSGTKNLLIKIADSNIDLNELSLNDDFLIQRGVLTQEEMNQFKELTSSNGNDIKEQLGITNEDKCEACNVSDEEKLDKLKNVITSIRNNKEEFSHSFDDFSKQVGKESTSASRFGTNPECNWKFYVCLATGTGATSGIAVAAVIYLCGCGFCKITPPGCW